MWQWSCRVVTAAKIDPGVVIIPTIRKISLFVVVVSIVFIIPVYISYSMSQNEYGAQVWHGGLTNAQSECIEKVQKRALRIIYSERDYEKILSQAGIHSLKSRRIDMCIDLIFTRCLIPNINCIIVYQIDSLRCVTGLHV